MIFLGIWKMGIISFAVCSQRWVCVFRRWGWRGRWSPGYSSIPSFHTLLPLCFWQMCKLREEKEQSMSQVQELETSLAELRNQIGKLRSG